MLLLTLATLSVARAQDDSELYMADMGVTATLPPGWSVPRWSDWDLDAVDNAQTTQVHVGYTIFQVPPSKDAATVWARLARESLEEKDHSDVSVVSTEVVEYKGVPVADVTLSYAYEGRQKAVLHQRSFNVDGRTVHLSATALTRNARRAEDALATWWDQLEIGKPAQDLSGLGGEVSCEQGFGSTLPTGWRRPLASETTEVRKIAAEAGQGHIDKDKCWVGIRTWPEGEASLLMACQYPLWTGVVDSYSFEGREKEMREHLFKGLEVPAAVSVPTGADDRLSFLYTLPASGDRALRMAATPYDQGHVLTYAFGPAAHAEALDGAIRAVLTATTFSGAEGAKHPIGALQWMEYTWNYRRSSPMFLGPVLGLVAIFGGLVALARRKKPAHDDDL